MPTYTWTVVAVFDGMPTEFRAGETVVADSRFAFVGMTSPTGDSTEITALVEAAGSEAAENIGRLNFAPWARMLGLPEEPSSVTAT